MKKIFLKGSLVFTLVSSFGFKTYACMAPDPFCIFVALSIFGGAVKGLNADYEPQKISVASKEEIVSQITKEVYNAENGHYMLRMQRYHNTSPAYSEVIKRYEKGKISGRLSLESLYDFSPRFFNDLDKLEAMIEKYTDTLTVKETYGPATFEGGVINWERYAKLASDAKLIYNHYWWMKDNDLL
ncbi:MAG: hypothetical protein KDD58_04360 [Bdellovibrionales bacterium]|nr:hypothetical protein [Bdellovibrionales bacterium]